MTRSLRRRERLRATDRRPPKGARLQAGVFDLGHRIELGGVRGDVLDIGLVRTTIMEMGVPSALFPTPHHWVAARQYTGRVVSVVNAEIFRQPVFNCTANFNLLWEELAIPLRYDTDLAAAERIVLAAARANTIDEVRMGREQLQRMRSLYLVEPADLEPQAFLQLTDNWIDLRVRFLVSTHGTRSVKDRICRQVLQAFRTEKIEIASQTFELVHAPSLNIVG